MDGFMLFDTLFFFLDNGDTLSHRLCSDAPILPHLPGQARTLPSIIQQRTQPVCKTQP
jgi:hypothetical protein